MFLLHPKNLTNIFLLKKYSPSLETIDNEFTMSGLLFDSSFDPNKY